MEWNEVNARAKKNTSLLYCNEWFTVYTHSYVQYNLDAVSLCVTGMLLMLLMKWKKIRRGRRMREIFMNCVVSLYISKKNIPSLDIGFNGLHFSPWISNQRMVNNKRYSINELQVQCSFLPICFPVCACVWIAMNRLNCISNDDTNEMEKCKHFSEHIQTTMRKKNSNARHTHYTYEYEYYIMAKTRTEKKGKEKKKLKGNRIWVSKGDGLMQHCIATNVE